MSADLPLPAGRTVLVTGASSGIGRALAQQLVADGDRVVALGRSAARLPADVTPWVADLATGEGLSGTVIAHIDVVFHCAGEITNPDLMRPLHVGGTARLLAVVRRTGKTPPRWVQLSSVGAYGPSLSRTRPRIVDEQTPERPQGEYEVTKTLADDQVRAAAAEGAISMAMVRPTAVIGPTLPSRSLRQLLDLVRRGRYVHVGPATAIANYVHVDDVVAALRACGRLPAAAGEVFNVASDCTWAALIAEFARAAGVREPRLRLPAFPVRALARVSEALGGPLTRARVDALTSHTTYSSHKIRAHLGVVPLRPMPRAVTDLLEPYGAG